MFVPPSSRPGTPAERYAANLAALATLRDLAGGQADAAALATLAQYCGWVEPALLKRISHPWKPSALDGEILHLLTPEQGRSVLESTPTAHYTPAALVEGVWAAVAPLLFAVDRPRILEPAAGTGAFIGHAPLELRERADFTAVELDVVAAAILGHLYPEARVLACGYEAADLPREHYDLVIGNVPFGEFGVADVTVPAWQRRPIHDYFFARALEHVRVGGVVALLTSRGTLDKEQGRIREHLARRADLLGVVRLPAGVFPDVGAQVIVDLVVLQRREPTTRRAPWVGTATIHWSQDDTGWDGRPFRKMCSAVVNKHVAERADVVVCGSPREVSAQYGRTYSVAAGDLAPWQVEIPARLAAQLKPGAGVPPRVVEVDCSAWAPTPKAEHPDNEAGRLWHAAYVAAKALLQAQADGCDDDAFEVARSEALEAYQRAETGAPLGSAGTRRALGAWDLLPFVEALQQDGAPAPLLLRRTVRGDVATALDLSDALALAINRTGRLDTGVIAAALGVSRLEVARDLVAQGLAFRDPTTCALVQADEYLSGDVRARLAAARHAAQRDREYAGNVEALTRVQPEDIPATSIGVSLGARWIPADVYEDFVLHVLPRCQVKVRYVEADCFFAVDIRGRGPEFDRWGTPHKSAPEIVETCLNLRPVKVYNEDGDKKVLDGDATLAAQAKAADLKEAFLAWLWTDAARRDRLVRLYNDRFNCLRRRRYDGSRLTFPGMSSAIELRPHQRAAIARALQSPRCADEPAFIHPGGAGKTFEVIATAVKGIQIGAWRRVLIVVPNHLIDQWHADVARLYPGWADECAIADTKDRPAFMARAALGRWPIIICTHSQLKLIAVSPCTEAALLQEEEARLLDYLDAADDDRQSVKRVQKKLKALRVKLEIRRDEIRRDTDKLATFEDLHIDCMIVDESQAFKNLGFETRLDVAGLSSSESQRALDMLMKMRHIQRKGGRTIFATATPVANTLAELHTVMRYLQAPRLKEMGIEHFDAFAGVFTETYQSVEMKPAGDGYRIVNRIRFYNLPELASLVAQSWDLCSVEDLHLDLPQLVGGAEDVVSVPASADLTAYIATLAKRAEAVKDGKVEPAVDNMLRITSDGRKAAMLNGDPASPSVALGQLTKIDACAARVLAHWRETAADLGAQLVFCDLYTPRAGTHDLDGEGRDPETPSEFAWAAAGVYGVLRHRLEEGGIPASEIAYIHDACTPAEKTALRNAVNAGAVRVLIGSTEKMSTGLNVQGRLIAVHHLDTPWRPDGIVQRNWRMIRQGNAYRHVYIHIYVTEGSFDAYMWGLQRAKLEVITQIMQAEPSGRTAEDIGDAVLSAAQVQAIASGDPRIMARIGLEGEIVKLDRSLRSWLEEQWVALRTLKEAPGTLVHLRRMVSEHRKALALVDAKPLETFAFYCFAPHAGAADAVLDSKEVAHSVLRRVAKKATRGDTVLVGTYRGCEVYIAGGLGDLSVGVPGTSVRYPARLTETPVGTFVGIDRAMASGPGIVVELERKIAQAQADVSATALGASRPWPHAQRYLEAFERYRRLTSELVADGTSLPLVVEQREIPAPVDVSAWVQPEAPAPVVAPRRSKPEQLSLFG